MHPLRRRRLWWVLLILIAVSLAVCLALYALRQNINLFFTPSQVLAGQAPKNQEFRIGGLVVKGSVHHSHDGKSVNFALTDTSHAIIVDYSGLLPDLFREGQGIVAEGKLDKQGQFIASQVLAKHDENYMPPQLAESLPSQVSLRA